jgi:hypothetical protein
MYVYISGEQSANFFQDNTHASFRVKLPKILKPSYGCKLQVALLDIELPKLADSYTTNFITINTDICEPQIVGLSLQPVLNRIYYPDLITSKPIIFDDQRYIDVTTENISSIHIYLLDRHGNYPSFKPGPLTCTLHFKEESIK